MKRTLLPLAVSLLVPFAGHGMALDLEFPGPTTSTATRTEPLTSYRLPTGPFADGTLQSRLTEGPLNQTAWRITAPGLTTLQLLQPLRKQIADAGFTALFECEAAACGGFDFRYATEVLPEPDMHIDLGDYRFLAAERATPRGPEYLSLIVSRAADLGFVQMIRVGQDALPAPAFSVSSKSSVPLGTSAQSLPVIEERAPIPLATAASTPLEARLRSGGAQVLGDLVFASGASTLSEGSYASLANLATFLRANPEARVMVVGHTDASGGLDSNIALSRKRAQSVRERLMATYDIPSGQIDAEGAGFLSPRAPNDTEAGRLANRRVEVILMTTEPN
ncbi:MAG: OmpA family protein [Paracoccaceae bacterium]